MHIRTRSLLRPTIQPDIPLRRKTRHNIPSTTRVRARTQLRTLRSMHNHYKSPPLLSTNVLVSSHIKQHASQCIQTNSALCTVPSRDHQTQKSNHVHQGRINRHQPTAHAIPDEGGSVEKEDLGISAQAGQRCTGKVFVLFFSTTRALQRLGIAANDLAVARVVQRPPALSRTTPRSRHTSEHAAPTNTAPHGSHILQRTTTADDSRQLRRTAQRDTSSAP